MCAQVVPSAEYLRGHGRVAVHVTALRRLWQHLPVLGLILACVPVCAVVVAVCQSLIKTIIIIIIKIIHVILLFVAKPAQNICLLTLQATHPH